MNTLEISWKDGNGTSHIKYYDNKTVAEKAYKWLENNGAANVKMSVHKHTFVAAEQEVIPDNPKFTRRAFFVKKKCNFCGEEIITDYKVSQ